MMTDAQLQARDAKRDVGAELLAAVREFKAGKIIPAPHPSGHALR